MEINLKKNDGLTLVELVVSIAIGSMILLATSAVLLLGLRIHHKTTDSVTQQFTVRTVITMLENIASEGNISEVNTSQDGSWKLFDRKYNVILSYSAEEQTICTGNEESVMLENIENSSLVMNGNVLTIHLEHEENLYNSSVFCRTVSEDTEDEEESVDGENQYAEEKKRFVNHLRDQEGVLAGAINHTVHNCNYFSCGRYDFFSEWYVGSENYVGYESANWSEDTAWCVCFVSWGLYMATNLEPQGPTERWFANVDDFYAYFPKETGNSWKNANDVPNVGDLIFFDTLCSGTNNPDHMGVVLSVSGNTISTIEGNHNNQVAIATHTVGEEQILGYGDPWAAQQGNS